MVVVLMRGLATEPVFPSWPGRTVGLDLDAGSGSHYRGMTTSLNPPAGRHYEVQGRRLFLHKSGSGGPAVVFLPGAGAFGLDYLNLHERVAGFTTCVLYDRAGTGWSDPVELPRTAAEVATELRESATASMRFSAGADAVRAVGPTRDEAPLWFEVAGGSPDANGWTRGCTTPPGSSRAWLLGRTQENSEPTMCSGPPNERHSGERPSSGHAARPGSCPCQN